MEEVLKRQFEFLQLAIRGNYMAANAQDMTTIYSRNAARKHLVVSNFHRSSFGGHKGPNSIAFGTPIFSGEYRRHLSIFPSRLALASPLPTARPNMSLREKI